MSMFTIQREVKVVVDEESGATIYAKVMGADEWLKYQMGAYALSGSDVAELAQFKIKFGKAWILRLEGMQFPDGSIVTVEHIGLLPVEFIVKVHDAVVEVLSVGKDKEESQTTSTLPTDQV